MKTIVETLNSETHKSKGSSEVQVSLKVNAQLDMIESFDLKQVKRKLMEPEPEGKGWTQEQVDEAEKWYRRYLQMIVKYPDITFVPNAPIDTFWHQHILDTQKYAVDCQRVLGYFLHHYPYFGMNGDEAEFRDAFKMTNQLYIENFGEDCFSMKHFALKNGQSCSGQPCGNRCQQK